MGVFTGTGPNDQIFFLLLFCSQKRRIFLTSPFTFVTGIPEPRSSIAQADIRSDIVM
jgi:hypothetical protein